MDNNNTLKKLDYLHFDAFSIKDAIIAKLSENTEYTDQLYEGSNLSVLIDLVAVMFQSLTYTLNNAASESMFSDTSIFENITRLVKFLNYTPGGYTTSVVTCDVINTTGDEITVPKFATLNIGEYDATGKPIYFSVGAQQSFYSSQKNEKQSITLYNGKWTLYNTVFTTKGTPNEIFTTTLSTNTSAEKYIDYSSMVVYFKKPTGEFIAGVRTNQINTLHVSPNSTILYYEILLDEHKQYNIKLGDNINVPAIDIGTEIYLFYLDTNGPYGTINENTINGQTLECSPTSLGVPQDIFNNLFTQIQTSFDLRGLYLLNKRASSSVIIEETVDSIRYNAPRIFSEGNRVTTAEDTKSWLIRNYANDILDCHIQNNWEYITNFYAWLYNIGKLVYNDGAHYIQPTILSKYALAYTDAADSNSVYVWIKTYSGAKIPFESITTALQDVKVLTSNIILMPVLEVHFAICLVDELYVKNNYLTTTNFDENNENYIEITVGDDLRYSPVRIKNEVKMKILSFFSEENYILGSTVDITELYSDIMDIPGVLRVRTVFEKTNTDVLSYETLAKQGLSFATWTNDVISIGDDLDVITSARVLEKFQFPVLHSMNLDNKIKIITSNQNITLKY